MAFVDEIQIELSAGRGGDGVERWLHEKGKEFGGPSGGDGGRGGDVYAVAIRNIEALGRYRSRKLMEAEGGESGRADSQHGKDGKDLVLEFPVGAVITNTRTGRTVELLEEGEKQLLLHGGQGGLGNEHFKSSTNTRPRQWTPGKDGERAVFNIELRLIVDVGLIGLPNAGKSSLLNTLTNAHAKVGSYAFTTLDPNLGDLYGLVLADIPGLIEGAATGKGLGHRFLRHIVRTRTLLHCVSLESNDPMRDYDIVRAELAAYSEELLAKPEIIVLTKSDTQPPAAIEAAKQLFSAGHEHVFTVSILDDESVKAFRDSLTALLRTDSNLL